MDKPRRNTKKYSFRQPDLKELRSLTSYVLDPLEFKAPHGKLLSILATQLKQSTSQGNSSESFVQEMRFPV
ncbi:hypothetical protein KIW84_036199 [Lathyrus oleraceus]|uniref:Uncharacterized protein n=1 Tax=Pisum sativum TaxID=3888 RepID=A0A9D5B747_PEA|nr:hypothetical protein KIW84_036199 [Pisum sativum]